jgi:hypothetical protein
MRRLTIAGFLVSNNKDWIAVGKGNYPTANGIDVDIKYRRGLVQLAVPANLVNWSNVLYFRYR